MPDPRRAASPTPSPARAAEPLVPVRVWDWPVRVFHWTLLLLVVAAVACVYAGGTWMDWHMRAGYAVLALLAFRIAWGFAGTRWARWASFVRGPKAVVGYARTLAVPPHAPSVGHNPLGGYMVVALVGVLLLQAGTGLFANDDIITEGPLAKLVSKGFSDRLTSLHVANQWVIYTLAALHVLAVAVHRLRFADDLVSPMFTGVKRLPARYAGAGIGGTPHVRALAIAAVCAAAVWALVTKV